MPATLVPIKRLAQGFVAQGKLAELEGHNEEAIRCYLDAIRLGNKSSRGGAIIHRLVGLTCEGIGLSPIKRMMTNLNCGEIQAAVSGLSDINENLVAWSEIARNERRFSLGQFKHYRNPIRLAGDIVEAHGMTKKSEIRDKKVTAQLRLLMVELAVRCYTRERGRLPEKLDNLIPKYIPSVPSDPCDGKSLRYRLQGTNWLVYSVGPDKIDNGGKRPPGDGTTAPGDTSLGWP